MSLPQDRDLRCQGCERWIKCTRVGYLAADQIAAHGYGDAHAAPLCPTCLPLGLWLELYASRYDRRVTRDVARLVAAIRAVHATLGTMPHA